MIENGTRENKTIGQSHSNANGDSFAKIAEHAARGRSVKRNRYANAREQRGNDIRLAFDRKSDVADERFVENFVNTLAIVDAVLGFARLASALRRRNGFGHDAPHGETWRGAGRFAAAHLICSRRQIGMNEPLLSDATTRERGNCFIWNWAEKKRRPNWSSPNHPLDEIGVIQHALRGLQNV